MKSKTSLTSRISVAILAGVALPLTPVYADIAADSISSAVGDSSLSLDTAASDYSSSGSGYQTTSSQSSLSLGGIDSIYSNNGDAGLSITDSSAGSIDLSSGNTDITPIDQLPVIDLLPVIEPMPIIIDPPIFPYLTYSTYSGLYQSVSGVNVAGESVGTQSSYQPVIEPDGTINSSFSQNAYYQPSDLTQPSVILADPNDDGSGVTATNVSGISDNDIVVGWDVLGDGAQNVFEYNVATNSYVDLAAPLSGDFLGASGFQSIGISSNGEFIIGQFTDANNNTEGFVFDTATGAWTAISETAAYNGYDPISNPYEYTSTSSVDNNGDVVGWYQDAEGYSHEYIFDAASGQFIDNNADQTLLATDLPVSIMPIMVLQPVWGFPLYYDRGVIAQADSNLAPVVYSMAAPINTAAVVPVPGAFWLMGSALAGLGWRGRRKA